MASSVSKSIVDAPTLKKFINEVKTARKDIFAGDNLANTLMHHAAARNKPEFIRWMAEQGVGVNYVNKMLMTPLHMACMFGSNEAVEE
ncbi:MAG: Transient receptor putative cation channel subfamily A member 1, partial [Marteilia pararefringens]